jgi:hypothetical protein
MRKGINFLPYPIEAAVSSSERRREANLASGGFRRKAYRDLLRSSAHCLLVKRYSVNKLRPLLPWNKQNKQFSVIVSNNAK